MVTHVGKSSVDEVPQVGPVSVTPASFMESFLSFSADSKERTMAAGDAYANKRVQLNKDAPRDKAKVASKVLVGAEFFPAHPSRFGVRGPGRGPKFKYFVVHRPGSVRWGDGRFTSYEAAVSYATRACNKSNILREFRFPAPPVSTQWVIGFDGSLVQMVDLDDVAYHTLNRKHPKTGDKITNYNSFGVELEGFVQDATDPRGASPFTTAQLATLGRLLKMLSDAPDFPYNITDPNLTVMHSEIDPARKIDPGPNFNVLRDALAWARKAGTFTSFYQAPVSLDVAERLAAQKFGALAGTNQSGQFREIMRGTAASMAATARASSLSRAGRSSYYRSAREIALRRTAATGETMAVKTRLEQIYKTANPAPQKNRAGLAKDFDTGKWND